MASREFRLIHNHVYGAAPRRNVAGLGVRTLLARLRAALRLWSGRARDRQALAGLNDRLLADIGLTREDASRICATPFWRAAADPRREKP